MIGSPRTIVKCWHAFWKGNRMPKKQNRYARLSSYQAQGLQPVPLLIEALHSRGISQLQITGLPDAWLRESRDKIRSLVAELAPWDALDKVLVQILPPDRAKYGAHLEFPIAAACLLALDPRAPSPALLEWLSAHLFVGALGLDGRLDHTESSLMLELAEPDKVLGPSRIPSLAAFARIVQSLQTGGELPDLAASPMARPLETRPPAPKVEGREWERFWLFVAAIAELPALLSGAPGTGKSHLARWASHLSPTPDRSTWFEIQQIWKLAGKPAETVPPVLTPHARTPLHEFIGTRRKGHCRPGLFSLAHGGTLILDEFLEMNRDSRETLRTVLEEKRLVNPDAGQAIEWPARFWLLATTNPCPCGYANGDNLAYCRCSPSLLNSYQSRLSGPMLDRFGVKLFLNDRGQSSHKIRERNASAANFLPEALRDFDVERLRADISALRQSATTHFAACLDEAKVRFEDFTSERALRNRARLLSVLRALRPAEADAASALLATKFQTEEPFLHPRRSTRSLTTGDFA